MSQRLIQDLRIHIDEAGRGPLAGPVFVGLVISLKQFDTSIFHDSKQLSEKQRELCYTKILELEQLGSCVFASGRAENTEIDELGIIAALRQATLRGLQSLVYKLYHLHRKQKLLNSVYGEDLLAQQQLLLLLASSQELLAKDQEPIKHSSDLGSLISDLLKVSNSIYSFKAILLDGNHTFGLDSILPVNITTIIKGDSKNPLISMASIVAKVERDHRMKEISPAFPGYDLATNKGYGTKKHRETIQRLGASPLHRKSFLRNIVEQLKVENIKSKTHSYQYHNPITNYQSANLPFANPQSSKPKLLLHICCAPDLTRPLHWLKNHFKLYLFWYNPNIHPRKEHDQRYSQFLKLVGLEKGDYEILEDRYDPKEFFDAMYDKKDIIHDELKDADYKTVMQKSGAMEEWSDRCNPCYLMRLEQAAKQALSQGIPYFTSTLLISPKKKMDKLFKRGLEAEAKYPGTRFLWFDFIKNEGYNKASQLTKAHGLWRQNYCGCGRTIPKAGERKSEYKGG